MSDDSEEICGYEKGTDGEPCEFTPSYPDGRCGHHTDHDTATEPDGRQSKLDDNPEIIDLIGEEIERGATIGEALSEIDEKTGVFIARGTHDRWMAKGKQDGSKTLYQKYRSEVRRARERAKRSGRKSIEREAIEKGDTRTMLELHKMQYGDLYADESHEDTTQAVKLGIPDELKEQWQQQIQQ
jgi:hypothetical protein